MNLKTEIKKVLDSSKKRGVPVEELVIAAEKILPNENSIQVRNRLFDLLELFEKESLIRRFSRRGKGWDLASGLPVKVWVIRQEEDERKKREKKEMEAFRNRIGWLPQILPFVSLLDKKQLPVAEKINNYLKKRKKEDPELIPHRERALEIFGDEKFLDKYVRSGLFGGKMSLKDLDCFYCAEPLTFEPLDFDTNRTSGKPLLIVENSSTYWSCCYVNREYGAFAGIVYGKGFKASNALSVCEELRKIEERFQSGGIFYFGDLDPKGLEIPYLINKNLQKNNRPQMKAALPLYRLLVKTGTPKTNTKKQSEFSDHKSFAELLLGKEIAETYSAQAVQNKRWAQEWLKAKDIRSGFAEMRKELGGFHFSDKALYG